MPARPLTQPLAWAALIALAASGCVVSFDGYHLDESDAGVGGAAGSSGLGGSSGSGGAGGSGAAGGSAGSGGLGGVAGSTGGAGGTGGATGGSAGSTGGSAGSTGGSAGSTGGAGGNGGVGGGTGGVGGGGTGGSSGSGTCPTHPALPAMKKVPKPGGGETCIDPYEISNAQYNDAFLADGPSLSGQPTGCSGNTNYTPPGSFECQWNASTTVPVRCVDWCDAYAFCAHVGKRLCGAFGSNPTPLGGLADHTQSEWFNVCSEGGTQAYVFGNSYSTALWNTCNGLENNASVVPSGSMTSCQCSGAYAGVFDLNGNLREWENACNGSNQCASRGGGHQDTGDPGSGERMRCDSAVLVPRLEQSEYRGFRCCADPS